MKRWDGTPDTAIISPLDPMVREANQYLERQGHLLARTTPPYTRGLLGSAVDKLRTALGAATYLPRLAYTKLRHQEPPRIAWP